VFSRGAHVLAPDLMRSLWLRIRRIARAEIFEAFNWYLVRSPRAAAGFIEAAHAAIRGIEEALCQRRGLRTGVPLTSAGS
jgi:hypothetical protein